MGALNDVGNAQMARQQDVYDMAYEDFLNQRDYERGSLGWLSGQIASVPVDPEGNIVKYQSNSLLGDVSGAGLAGISAYNNYPRS